MKSPLLPLPAPIRSAGVPLAGLLALLPLAVPAVAAEAGHAAAALPPVVNTLIQPALPVAAPAQAEPLDLQALAARVRELETRLAATDPDTLQRLRLLERKQQLMDEEARRTAVAGDKGFSLKSADGNFELRLRGLMQVDARLFLDGLKGQHAYLGDGSAAADLVTDPATDNLLVRRARPILEGSLYESFGFRLTTDFGNNGVQVADAYLDAAIRPWLRLRAGKFTPPLGLERLQSSAETRFAELSLVSDLIPTRDIGVQAGGEFGGGLLAYSAGLFNGAVDAGTGDLDASGDKEWQLRLFAKPFVNHPGWLQGLGVGVAGSSTDTRGRTARPTSASGITAGTTELASYRSIGQETMFSYRTDTDQTSTVFADGGRRRLVPQFAWFRRNLGLLGEYVREKQEVTRVWSTTGPAAVNSRRAELAHEAWQLTLAWAITGEEESLGGLKPGQDYAPGRGGRGAWELVLRHSVLDLDESAFGCGGALPANAGGTTQANLYACTFAEAPKSVQAADHWGLGLNWYPNRMIRVVLDYDETGFRWGGGGISTAPLDRATERVLTGRLQAAF
jgi:phosphate-selective porin OprO/OprP